MRLFTRSLMTDLSAQQVVEELSANDLDLTLDTAVSRLNKLVIWGNPLPSSHTVRVKSIEEYQRTRSRFRLTPLGERVQRQTFEVLSSVDAAREISREPAPDPLELRTRDNNDRLRAAVGSSWDPALAEVMTELGASIHEEALLEGLLTDL